ncbi:DUF4327 family protein [Chamaesiphon sp.]|uniref:DUF4327 family protein n=1 Tax=Chamaesiphon sp. TaxID=2814140 RepID=UPI00359342E9
MAVIERYRISDFQDEVRTLVARGFIDRQQRIYELKQFFGDRQWREVEHLVAAYDYVLRGRVIDLVGAESWEND